MTRSNVEKRLDLAVARAILQCPSLSKKRISPHVIRHATAMRLLQSGVAFNIIALWLGHESPNTTHRYVEADLAMKKRPSRASRSRRRACAVTVRQTLCSRSFNSYNYADSSRLPCLKTRASAHLLRIVEHCA